MWCPTCGVCCGQWWTLVLLAVILSVVPIDLDAVAEAVTVEPERPYGRFGVRCKTCRLLLDLPPGDDPRAVKVRAAINGPVEAETLAAQLRAGGVPIGADSIRKHRRGLCKTREAADAHAA